MQLFQKLNFAEKLVSRCLATGKNANAANEACSPVSQIYN